MQLSEEQVTISKLVEIFNNSFMEISDLSESGFLIKGDKINIRLNLDGNKKLLQFMDFTRLKNITQQQANEIVNFVNSNYVLVKFYTINDNGNIILASSLELTYVRGVLGFHIISNLKTFERIVCHALSENFLNYI